MVRQRGCGGGASDMAGQGMSGGASPRRRGDYFERQARAHLEANGWLVVRSGGSLGPADLIAICRTAPPLLISCKIGGYVPPAERRELATIAERYGAVAVVMHRPKRGVIATKPIWAVKDDHSTR